MATNEPFWLGVPKSNMWPSRDSFQFEDAASERRKSAAAFADTHTRATSRQPGWGAGAGSGKQLGEKQLPSYTGRKNRHHLLWMLVTLVKVKLCRKHRLSEMTTAFVITASRSKVQALWWEVMGALRFWVFISISISIWDHTTSNWTPLIMTRGGHFICHDHILLLRSFSERLVWGNSPKYTLKDMPIAKKFPCLYQGTRYLFPFISVPNN